MVQIVSSPLPEPQPQRRAAKRTNADLGAVFGSLGEDMLMGDRTARPMGDAGPPAMPSALSAAPGGSGSSGPVKLASPEIAALLDRTAAEYGLDPKAFARIAHIESGGDPRAVTGSYQGLFQLGPSEWSRYGGGGNVFDAQSNARAAAAKMRDESNTFTTRYGRAPSADELYMVHQQGAGGYAAHSANPDAPAWQNMASTGEGRQKGSGWARQAIWGNVPTQYRSQFGNVDNITSRQFMDMWRRKVGM